MSQERNWLRQLRPSILKEKEHQRNVQEKGQAALEVSSFQALQIALYFLRNQLPGERPINGDFLRQLENPENAPSILQVVNFALLQLPPQDINFILRFLNNSQDYPENAIPPKIRILQRKFFDGLENSGKSPLLEANINKMKGGRKLREMLTLHPELLGTLDLSHLEVKLASRIPFIFQDEREAEWLISKERKVLETALFSAFDELQVDDKYLLIKRHGLETNSQALSIEKLTIDIHELYPSSTETIRARIDSLHARFRDLVRRYFRMKM